MNREREAATAVSLAASVPVALPSPQDASAASPAPADRAATRARGLALAELIPVIYGALLSYAMYVVGQVAIELKRADLANGVVRVASLLAVCAFVSRDVGESVVLNRHFPMRNTWRYSAELAVGLFYVVTFSLISDNSFVFLLTFGLAVIAGGMWANQLHKEYGSHTSGISHFAVTVRDIHYWGGAGFVILWIYTTFWATNRGLSFEITWESNLLPLVYFGLWLIAYDLILLVRHGEAALDFMVEVPVVTRVMRRLCLAKREIKP